MAAPSNEFEHLQSVYRRSINKIIREEFKDVNDDDDVNLSRGSGVSKAALKYACLHKDNDTAAMTQMRTDLFYLVLRKAADMQAPIYGIPVESYQESVSFKPQIELYFSENPKEKPKDRSLARTEITFRLMNESIKTLTDAEVKRLARKIKEIFATPIVSFKRGKTKVTYYDKPNGYRLSFFVSSKAEGKKLLDKVLQIQGDEIDEYLLTTTTREKDTPKPKDTSLESKLLMGRPIKQYTSKPTATVHFRYASLKIHGLTEDIVLIDTTNRYWDAIESA